MVTLLQEHCRYFMWSDMKQVRVLSAVIGLKCPDLLHLGVPHPCTLPIDPEVPFKLRLGPSDFAWAASQVWQFSVLSSDGPWTCSVVLFPVLSLDFPPAASDWTPWMDPGPNSSPHLSLSVDPVNSTCLCPCCSDQWDRTRQWELCLFCRHPWLLARPPLWSSPALVAPWQNIP